MAKMSIMYVFAALLLLPSVFHMCSAHSFILEPPGDFISFKKGECRQGGPSDAPADDCKGPCIDKGSWQYNKNEGLTTYKRGQLVSMAWTRNNHRGGFVRFTLIPESQRMDEEAHDLFAFRYACYDSDKHVCIYDTSKERKCGTDSYIHRARVEIPTSLEDGYYILGWAWYGGIDWEHKSFFGDYWSCSRIRIEGGLLTEKYTPVFNPGESVRNVDPKNPTCMASTDRLRDCSEEPCLGRPVMHRVPAKFKDGKEPAPILRSWTEGKRSSPTPTKTPSPIPHGPRSKPSPAPTVYTVELRLLDTDTNHILAKDFPSEIYVSRSVKGLTFLAKVRGDPQAVKFYINNEFTHEEREVPFTAFGAVKGMLQPWHKPIFNEWFKVKVDVIGKQGDLHQNTFSILLKRSK